MLGRFNSGDGTYVDTMRHVTKSRSVLKYTGARQDDNNNTTGRSVSHQVIDVASSQTTTPNNPGGISQVGHRSTIISAISKHFQRWPFQGQSNQNLIAGS